jgi:Protein of unknown function (DUF2842)
MVRRWPIAAAARLRHFVGMTVRTRKLIGTVTLLVFLAAFVGLVAAIGLGRIAERGALSVFAYALVAGFVWVIPAGFLIRWMQRP